MTELELTEILDQAFSISEEYATEVTNKILSGADTMTYLAFAKYCRNFLMDVENCDVLGATPDARRSLAEMYSQQIQLLEALIAIDQHIRFNNILGDLKIDL